MPRRTGAAARALVVGGGVSGLACATALAERGYAVTLLESRHLYGGRSATWFDPAARQPLDNGPHLVAGAYRELQRFLRRSGAGHARAWSVARPVVLTTRDGDRTARLGGRPGRLALARDLLSYAPLSWRERAGLGRVLLSAARPPEPDRALGPWLDDLGQSPAARRWLWDPMARAVFNDRPERVSARLFAGVLDRLFLRSPDAFVLSYPVPSLDAALVAPAVRTLNARDAELVSGVRVESVERENSGFRVFDGAGRAWRGELLCLAVPARAAGALLGEAAASVAPLLPGAAAAPTTPLVSVALWVAGGTPRLPHDFLGVVDGEFAWVFDRRGLLGGEPSEPIVLVAPGDETLASRPAGEIAERAWEFLARLTGNAERASRRASRVVKEMHAAPVLSPECASRRPATRTAWPGLALAGDWTETGLPATLEGAAASGHRAAAALHAFAARGAWYLEPSS